VGFTPRLATGVWVGYDRPRSLGKDETGSRVAVPIWVSYMGKVLGDSPREDFPVPEKIVFVPVDLDPSNECVRVVSMAFVKGTEPLPCGRRPAVPPPLPPAVPAPMPPQASPAPGASVLPTPPALPRNVWPLSPSIVMPPATDEPIRAAEPTPMPTRPPGVEGP
jgi:membrane peptidoglycan carboxypeptidase